MHRASRRWLSVAWLIGVVACGGRTPLKVDLADAGPDASSQERCDGLDNDMDTRVDEGFRDELGRYVNDEHCGACGVACDTPIANAITVGCGLAFESPACVPTQCADGFGPTLQGTCALLNAHVCLPCLQDNECGDLIDRACTEIANEQRCTLRCETGLCPAGYSCDVDRLVCLPDGGSCSCEPGENFTLACVLTNSDGTQCTGSAQCADGTFSECSIEESCDEQDNDCDGRVDETFRNTRGAYAIDERHCGMCGVDCNASEQMGVELRCGGDPLSPSCVLDCPDDRDGRDPGDLVDGDGAIGNGCECTFTTEDDVPGPVGSEGEMLDQNCDGADGIVLDSLYVAPDGDDGGPGSPTRPLRTVAEAIAQAARSLNSNDAPRRDIYIAAGNYVEELRVPNGVRIHGGYRRDFRALDPEGFRVVWLAPANTSAPGGAAAVIEEGAGVDETVVEWVELRGSDAVTAGAPAIGLWIESVAEALVLRDMTVRTGIPGDGMHGASGNAGQSPVTQAQDGGVQRASIEDINHVCIPGSPNTVRGGSGGANTCGGAATHGGNGGSPGCPLEGQDVHGTQPAGASGIGAGVSNALPGLGGDGGTDLIGPITRSCPNNVCCGLADFSVPSDFRFPQAGQNGQDGGNGQHGNGCTDALGRFMQRRWMGGDASNGTAGRAGAGGGGGGGGGTARMDWFDGVCEFVDGIGGGGGGGGAGGCGGQPGTAGTSGGPAIGIVIEGNADAITIQGVRIEAARGGRGGDGGVGGEGALGGVGGFGGAVPRQSQSIPTLAGAVPGARGGRGGNGGAGGGAGGGCGGSTVGIWITGGATMNTVRALDQQNTITLGPGGDGGRGGSGAVPAAAGSNGGMLSVRVR